MRKSQFALVFSFIFFTSSVSANLIQWDAFEVGDELAVKDESTGFIWLDLALTANVHFRESGTMFDGWSYASYVYVESLLENIFFDIDISGTNGEQYLFEQNCGNTTNCFSTAKTWQQLFGSIEGTRYYQTHSYGLYEDEQGVLRVGGSYLNGSGSANRYGVDFNVNYSTNYEEKFNNNEFYNVGTFLIKNDSLPVNLLQLSPSGISVNEPTITFILALALATILRGRRKRLMAN
ncbi:hypothetical protein [Paraglaciecola arctica]|uniref:hypothetical protein n=1 Tax=Paraglaciecola arctica TaxID=1128911 RepID=UPI00209111D6|nr:hypothetical protein [Paraglaciecola arctica]